MSLIPGGTGVAASFPDGFTGSQLANVETISSTLVLTTSSRRTQLLTPSGALRVAQLPATALLGEQWVFICSPSAAFSLQVNSSNGSQISLLAPGESVSINAGSATPVANTDWIAQVPTTILSNGSVSTPALRFTGSGSDTGIYSPSTDAIAFSNAGVQSLLVSSVGAVTIGVASSTTGSLQHQFYLPSGSGASGSNTASTTQSYVKLLNATSAGAQTVMVFNAGSTGGGSLSGCAGLYSLTPDTASVDAGDLNFNVALNTSGSFGAAYTTTSRKAYAFSVNTVGDIATATRAGSWTVGPTSAIGGSTFAGSNIVGKNNASTVSAGYVGEQFNISLSNVGLTSGVTANAGTMNLTAGVWVIYYRGGWDSGGSSAITTAHTSISTVSATRDNATGIDTYPSSAIGTAASYRHPPVIKFVNISATTTYYAVTSLTATSASGLTTLASTSYFYAIRIA